MLLDKFMFLIIFKHENIEARVNVAYATIISNRFFSPLIFIKCLQRIVNTLFPLHFMIPWDAAVNIPI